MSTRKRPANRKRCPSKDISEQHNSGFIEYVQRGGDVNHWFANATLVSWLLLSPRLCCTEERPGQDLIATNNDIKVTMAPYRNDVLLTVETIRLERHI